MTTLVKEKTNSHLTRQKLDKCLHLLKKKLEKRVEAAYVFGSAASATITKESDIDLILVVKNTKVPFVERGFVFLDLFDIFPKLDLLVYTQEEIDIQLSDSKIGFWKSVRESMKRII